MYVCITKQEKKMKIKENKAKFEEKEELTKINIKKFFGSYERMKEILNMLGYEVIKVKAHEGETGTLYKIRFNGKEYIGICNYPTHVTPKKGKKYTYYTYYLMEPEALQDYLNLLY